MLKHSRRNCWNAEAGIPTWTGSSGAVRPKEATEKQVLLFLMKYISFIYLILILYSGLALV